MEVLDGKPLRLQYLHGLAGLLGTDAGSEEGQVFALAQQAGLVQHHGFGIVE